MERGGVMERGCGVVGGNVWGVLGGGEERSGVEVEGVEGCVGWWRVCVCVVEGGVESGGGGKGEGVGGGVRGGR